MNLYASEPPFEHGEIPAVGVLLANLGTPDAPTAPALRRYLRQFLGDPRVIEIARWKWRLILNLFILPFRPRQSAALYRTIWRQDGSPLLTTTVSLGEAISEQLRRRVASPIHLAVGMRYGEPSIRRALDELRQKRCDRIVVLPLFPQYSGTTVASVFDAVAAELTRWRVVPSLRTIHQYHDHEGYIGELAASIRERWEAEGPPERLLFSFHGIPERYFAGGDPYHCQCHKTARLVAERLGLVSERYEVAFQSIFGKEEWIKPTTDVTVRAMARAGIRSLDVVCPGFAVDCLETLEEIDEQNRHFFLDNGGERFGYIPCLNDRPGHVEALSGLLLDNLGGWVASPDEWDAAEIAAEAAASRQRAEALRRRGCPADAGYGAGGA
ncbi:MAG: ferrochelatase [Thermoanaerobaculia bacterium]|nr:ferrochelatase [Thermoanaerobaculia bacterium]